MVRAGLRWGWVVCGLLFAAGTADAQYFGQNKVQYRQYKWRYITSDHFEVYFYPGLDSLAVRVLDLAEKTNAELSRRMGHRLARRVPVILYGSHSDFSQTNVTPEIIDAGTGGFTELLRNRVVLPFTGSYEDLRHVVVHELVHAFMFDLLYGGSAASLIARQSLFQPPLWFAEGIAEYFSLGMESNAEMILRDGTVAGYLPPLMYSGGYIVYKQGQSAISYLVDTFGEERLRDLLLQCRQLRSFDRAFQRSLGMPVERFDEQWREWLRKRYWPTVAHKQDPEGFARRLTDHRRDESNLNTAPAVSPQGDRVAFFSDRHQYTEVMVMSALDGKVLRRLIRGERSVQFEGLPSFRSSLAWSPDGTRVALVAKSGGREVLYVVRATNGRVLKRVVFDCEALAYPAWSPVSDSIAVVGVRDGRSDLWMVRLTDGAITRLTDDTHDETEPTWRGDGSGITFSSDRGTAVVLHPYRQQNGFGAYGIYDLDLASREIRARVDTGGDDRSPAWSPDGRKLAFVSDRGGTPNIYVFDAADSTVTQMTDVMGGVVSLSWSRVNDRMVFSAFNHGGFDVFTVKEPLSLDPVLARLKRERPASVLTVAEAALRDSATVPPEPSLGALAGAWPDSETVRPDTLDRATAADAERPLPSPVQFGAPSAWNSNVSQRPTVSDTLAPLPTVTPLVERGGPFAVPDSVLAQQPRRYRVRIAPDYAVGGLYASSNGFSGASQFVFSDFLGNHSIFLLTDVFNSSLTEADALVIYNYLPRRWDFGGGFFHFKDYYSSSVTTLGEALDGPRLFSERNFGVLLSAAYPLDRYRRFEVNFTQRFVERTFFQEDPLGLLFEGETEFRSVTSPWVSLVGDYSLFGYYGPVNGQRYNLSFVRAWPVFHNGLSFETATFDGRRYWDLGRTYTFAGRVLAGWSGGRDPQSFRLGGFSTLRGLEDFETRGTRFVITNAELRFPFIQQLGLVGPVPIGVFNMRGAAFLDAGAVWNEGDRVQLFQSTPGGFKTRDLQVGFGTGIRTVFLFLILKTDVAWLTDFDGVSKPRWHFSIGPEF